MHAVHERPVSHGGFPDDDSMEDAFDDDFGSEDSLDDDSGIEDEPAEEMCEDEFTDQDTFITGTAFGFGYEEGLLEAERRRLEKKMNDDQDHSNNRS